MPQKSLRGDREYNQSTCRDCEGGLDRTLKAAVRAGTNMPIFQEGIAHLNPLRYPRAAILIQKGVRENSAPAWEEAVALMFSNVGLAEIGFEGGFQTWTRHPLPLVTTGQGIFANYTGFELSSCNRKHQRRKQLKNGHLLFLGVCMNLCLIWWLMPKRRSFLVLAGDILVEGKWHLGQCSFTEWVVTEREVDMS